MRMTRSAVAPSTARSSNPLFWRLSTIRSALCCAARRLIVSYGTPSATTVLIGLAPLMVFAGKLSAFKRQSRAAIGVLLSKYGHLFERRWLREQTVNDGGMLGAPEIGPVADTVALFEAVSRMRVMPIGRSAIVPLALATALPMVPVLATQIPLKEALAKVLAPLIGL